MHLACYSLLAIAFVVVLLLRYARPVMLAEPITVEPALVSQVDQRLDPNVAEWAELAALPEIGETIAKRIVEARQPHEGTGLPAFTKLADLDEIKGIGPKTLERLAPHLRFPIPADD